MSDLLLCTMYHALKSQLLLTSFTLSASSSSRENSILSLSNSSALLAGLYDNLFQVSQPTFRDQKALTKASAQSQH